MQQDLDKAKLQVQGFNQQLSKVTQNLQVSQQPSQQEQRDDRSESESQKDRVQFSLDTMDEFSHEELQEVIRQYASAMQKSKDRVKTVQLEYSKLEQVCQSLRESEQAANEMLELR